MQIKDRNAFTAPINISFTMTMHDHKNTMAIISVSLDTKISFFAIFRPKHIGLDSPNLHLLIAPPPRGSTRKSYES